MVAVALALGLPLLAGEPGRALGSSDVALVAGGSLVAAALSRDHGRCRSARSCATRSRASSAR